MKRWTNRLPGATMRLGAMMAQRGLSVSQPRMRADTHVGPELNAPLQRPDTLMQLSRSSLLEFRLVQRGRAIHHGTILAWTADEIVIRHEDPSVGKVNVHFPRVGFDVAPAQRLAARDCKGEEPPFLQCRLFGAKRPFQTSAASGAGRATRSK